MSYLLWAVLLVAQNASFTWVSRARNSGSDWWHATAACFSNGVWFVAFFYTFDFLDRARSAPGLEKVGLVALYTLATVAGSVFAGRILRRYFERGSRRVGAYEGGSK